MDDIDRTFAALKKSPIEKVTKSVIGLVIVNPMTFELELPRRFHNIITQQGWSVDEYFTEFNYHIYDTK